MSAPAEVRLNLRCGKCGRVILRLERRPGRWSLPLEVAPVRQERAGGTSTSDYSYRNTYRCAGARCGAEHTVNSVSLLEAADRAFALGVKDLYAGRHDFGLPRQPVQT